MDPDDAAAATERYFRELPRVVHRVCAEWSSTTDKVLRRSPHLPGEVRKGIRGRAIRYNGQSFAEVTCSSLLGMWIETGTGIYGPTKRPIRAKGGAYTDALGRHRVRRMLRWKGTIWDGVRSGGGSGVMRTVASGGKGITYRHREVRALGASYRGVSGYIFAFEVRGSKARPWFFPGIQRRIPIFRAMLERNMAAATDQILAGGRPLQGLVYSG